MSNTIRWRIALASLTAVSLGGLVLITLLAIGLADPPHVGSLQWQVDSPLKLPDSLAVPPAFTLELNARNNGPVDSAWGMRLTGRESSLTILIDNQGYLSLSTDGVLHWAEFPHIRPNASNQLYLHVEPEGAATLRINHEIAWAGRVNANSWEIVEHGQPELDWRSIALYHE